MKDLKFRAWVDNEMVYLPFAALQYFDFEGSYALSFVVDGYKGFWAHECYERISKERCANAPIMQYIGIKDRDDKEIYVGDIVNCNRYESEDNFLVVIDDIRNIPRELFGSNLNYREVIGNIYANPDLLNDNKPLNPLDHEQTK